MDEQIATNDPSGCIDSSHTIIREGDWGYRLNEDGTAVLIDWYGDIYDPGGVDAVVPEAFGSHVLVSVEGDPFGAERISGLVDSGYYPGMSVTSRPDSPVRVWCSSNASDYLSWDSPKGFDERICSYTLLDDESARIDFWWCRDESFDIPSEVDGHRVSELGDGSFSFMEARQVTIPEGVKTIGNHAFRWCYNLEHIELPSTLVRIGDGAFQQCIDLTQIALTPALQEIGDRAFCKCSLAKLDVPQSVQSIGESAFEDCEFTSVTLHVGLRHLGRGAFSDCWDLESIELPEGLEAIEPFAFSYCHHLRSVTVPEGVTSIGGFAFEHSGVARVRLPGSVEHIDDHAFVDCNRAIRIDAPCGSYAERWCFEHKDLIGKSFWDLF